MAMRGSAYFAILNSPNHIYATHSEFIVVQMFAHNTTQIALCNHNNHAQTKATSNKETNVLLVVSALIRVHARIHFPSVFVCASRRRLSCLHQSAFTDSSNKYNQNISNHAPARNVRHILK